MFRSSARADLRGWTAKPRLRTGIAAVLPIVRLEHRAGGPAAFPGLRDAGMEARRGVGPNNATGVEAATRGWMPKTPSAFSFRDCGRSN